MMKKVLINDEIIDVEFFENKSNKDYPFFQNGNKYAICPWCKTSVQIIGGNNNTTKSNQKKIYASHTKNKIQGINFDVQLKEECIYYKGNKNNWQKIYTTKNDIKRENSELKNYISNNISSISKEIEEITRFKCSTKLFEKIYNSFCENKGLYVEKFAPDYVSRQIICLAEPVSCWGHVIREDIKNIINQTFINSLEKEKFKPDIATKLVGVLDNDVNPTKVIIKLLYGDKNELTINEVSAEVK